MYPRNQSIPSLRAATGILIILGTIALVGMNYEPAGGNGSGAPASRTGSPGDLFLDCTECHTGSATSQSGLITSTIPLTGYVPGIQYTVTGTISAAGKTKFGFEMSPQLQNGTKAGTLVITNAAATKFTGTGQKYITHTSAGTSGPTGTRSWSFDWIAPVAGTGDITFYGAFNVTNSSNSSSGDIIYLSTLAVSENTSTGTAEVPYYPHVSVYPNPAAETLTLHAPFRDGRPVSVTVTDLAGRTLIREAVAGTGTQSFDVSGLAPGVCLLKIDDGSYSFVVKFVKL